MAIFFDEMTTVLYQITTMMLIFVQCYLTETPIYKYTRVKTTISHLTGTCWLLHHWSDLFLNWWPKCWSKHRHTCTCNTSQIYMTIQWKIHNVLFLLRWSRLKIKITLLYVPFLLRHFSLVLQQCWKRAESEATSKLNYKCIYTSTKHLSWYWVFFHFVMNKSLMRQYLFHS